MTYTITPASIADDPASVTSTFETRDGESVTFRPLHANDGRILGEYFLGLSDATKDLYGPHPFTQEMADQLCDKLDPTGVLRMIATTEVKGREQIIAYFLLEFAIPQSTVERYQQVGIELSQELDCQIAPSVADAYQSKGLGSLVFERHLVIARVTGRRYVVLQGGVRAVNERGIHFYKKFGFITVGEFETRGNNFDMYLPL